MLNVHLLRKIMGGPGIADFGRFALGMQIGDFKKGVTNKGGEYEADGITTTWRE
jgi:hypothetical protein